MYENILKQMFLQQNLKTNNLFEQPSEIYENKYKNKCVKMH